MATQSSSQLRPSALTMGEPAGIGAEITVKAWQALRSQQDAPPFFVIDDPARYGPFDVPIAAINHPAHAARTFPEALPVFPLTHSVTPTTGQPLAANAPAVLEAIEKAVKLTAAGLASAVVTNPIEKKVLVDAGFSFPGHTDYLGALTRNLPGASPSGPVMMLAGPSLRTVPVTVHTALAKVPTALTTQDIVAVGACVDRALRVDFGIEAPRLVVAGLNPHAGEGGLFGHEDTDIIAPAIAKLRRQNIKCEGPLPADTLFHSERRAQYDAALCMYHDQALIPVKTIDFHHTVNVTLGLPIIRTSPDHGTALDIAGKDVANPTSLISALTMAAQLATHRRHHRAP
ncbi:MAG: 4-hydroxythreonine-4-phosphate dehydrogenase PdxA [Pseudomonadota bacterium]